MHKAYKNVKEMVRNSPLLLLQLKDKKLIEYANSFLPYSTGIEIECRQPVYEDYLRANKEMHQIGLVSFSSSMDEQRIRIPAGIEGMVALYKATLILKKYFKLNPLSGLHYHVDFTDVNWTSTGWGNLQNERKPGYITQGFIDDNSRWILDALKHWGYTGSFNAWKVSQNKDAVKFHVEYKTVEFRIGEMTFDYELMMKRIINCQNISKKIKFILNKPEPKKKENGFIIEPLKSVARRVGAINTDEVFRRSRQIGSTLQRTGRLPRAIGYSLSSGGEMDVTNEVADSPLYQSTLASILDGVSASFAIPTARMGQPIGMSAIEASERAMNEAMQGIREGRIFVGSDVA